MFLEVNNYITLKAWWHGALWMTWSIMDDMEHYRWHEALSMPWSIIDDIEYYRCHGALSMPWIIIDEMEHYRWHGVLSWWTTHMFLICRWTLMTFFHNLLCLVYFEVEWLICSLPGRHKLHKIYSKFSVTIKHILTKFFNLFTSWLTFASLKCTKKKKTKDIYYFNTKYFIYML